jgi:aspartyl-tRNA(Asn)/glutamyl-tRNA(Gln) amidotransferase subunit A
MMTTGSKPKRLFTMSDDITYLSAIELLDAYSNRQLSPVEVVDASLARIENLQPTVNAFVTVCAENARRAAMEAEKAYKNNGDSGTIGGIPFSAKDLIQTEGVRTTLGSAIFSDNVPDTDAVVVQRMKESGGILIGKTTTPALGHKAITSSLISGVSRNPWNLDHTCGGSSGGAAAAVASGMGPFAIGTDGGGSVRIPASCCGTVGLKPTLGRVPNEFASDLFGSLSYTGPLTRTVADAALMLTTMTGPDGGDPWSRGQPRLPDLAAMTEPSLVKHLKAAWFPLLGNSELDSEVKSIVEAAVAELPALGIDVDLAEDVLDSGDAMWRAISYSAQNARMAEHIESNPDLIDPSLRTNMEEGAKVSGLDLQQGLFARSNTYRAIERVFDQYALMVTPTLAAPPPFANFDAHDEIIINGNMAGKLRAAWYAYAHPFNMSGHPAISLPCGWTDNGLPVGIQFIAPWYREDLLLQVATAFEQARPWADKRPHV